MRLTSAELVIGDVGETVTEFLKNADLQKPIGFVSFYLDYWSSTLASFEIFSNDPRVCLTRVWCWFDDIAFTVEDIGELLAIRVFNGEGHGRRILRPHSLRAKVPFKPMWVDQIFVTHLFDHPEYNTLLADRDAEKVELGKKSA